MGNLTKDRAINADIFTESEISSMSDQDIRLCVADLTELPMAQPQGAALWTRLWSVSVAPLYS